VSARREVAFWVAQRATSIVLAFCVLVHLATMIYAIRNGLSAAEILGRTRGSLAWGAFYSTFVIAAAVHGALGLRTVAAEWLGFRGEAAEYAMTLVGLVLTIAGLRAVAAVVGAPA
jgi:fumarate reductase subunit C